MKTLLGAGALVVTMAAGAWSSDALPLGDDPARDGRHQQQRTGPDGERGGGRDDAPGRARRAGEHPHGAPPGQDQRGRGERPAWAGGPDERTAEPPGLARKPD